MSKSLANVDITTDTFSGWLTKTNQLLDAIRNDIVTVSNTTIGNTTGNARIIGIFSSDTLVANGYLRGGNVSTNGTLRISSNVNIGNSLNSPSLNVYGLAIVSNDFVVTGQVNSTAVMVGNDTVNAFINSTSLVLANSTVNTMIGIPTAAEVAGNYYLHANGSWVAIVSTTPGGVNTNIIYNNSGNFGASANLSFDSATAKLIVGNSTVNATVNSTSFRIANSTSNTALPIPSTTIWNAGNYFLNANGSWVQVAASPGGANTQINFNDSGSFGANVNLTFNKDTSQLTVGNSVVNVTANNTMLKVGSNVAINTSTISIGNSQTNTTINSISFAAPGTGTIAVGANVLANATTIFVGNSIMGVTLTGAGISANGTLSIGGDATLAGNNSLNGGLQSLSGNVNFSSNALFFDAQNKRLGVGTNVRAYPLHVNGSIYSTGDVISFSSLEGKENIINISNALQTVSNLRGVSYSRKDTHDKQIGLIAQEVAAIIPEVVFNINEQIGISYPNLVALLIEAIKELKTKVETLEMNK